MTTPNEELILKLRGQAYTTCRPDQLCDQAADLLQSQAERIAELEVIVASYGELDVEQAKHIACMESDLDTLRAQLAAIAATEPVNEPVNEPLAEDIEALDVMYRGDPSYEHDGYYIKTQAAKLVRKGYELFTRPMPAQDVTELVDALEALIESTTGVDQVSVVNDARTALSKYKGGKA